MLLALFDVRVDADLAEHPVALDYGNLAIDNPYPVGGARASRVNTQFDETIFRATERVGDAPRAEHRRGNSLDEVNDGVRADGDAVEGIDHRGLRIEEALRRIEIAGEEGVTRMCERLASESGDRVGTVDLVLWRAAAIGLIDTRAMDIACMGSKA